MPRVIWVECPHCSMRFYLFWDHFYGKRSVKPQCPKCKKEFLQDESPWMWAGSAPARPWREEG